MALLKTFNQQISTILEQTQPSPGSDSSEWVADWAHPMFTRFQREQKLPLDLNKIVWHETLPPDLNTIPWRNNKIKTLKRKRSTSEILLSSYDDIILTLDKEKITIGLLNNGALRVDYTNSEGGRFIKSPEIRSPIPSLPDAKIIELLRRISELKSRV